MSKSKDGDDGHREDVIAEIEKHLIKEKIDEKAELMGASGVVSDKVKSQGSALHKIITISENARQILAMANFRDPEEAEDVVAALVECRRYGLSEDMVLDWVSAHCGIASQGKSVREWGVQALTHLELGTGDQHKLSWRGQKKEEKPGS